MRVSSVTGKGLDQLLAKIRQKVISVIEEMKKAISECILTGYLVLKESVCCYGFGD